MKLGWKYQFKRIVKDFWIHLILSTVSIIIICKFSNAPVCCEALANVFLRPADGTVEYEVFRVLENLSLAYLAALIFYLIVTYGPSRKQERRAIKHATSHIESIQMWMSRVINYLAYDLAFQDIERCTEEHKAAIDNYTFPDIPEFLYITESHKEDNVSGHVELYNGREQAITAGRILSNELKAVYELFVDVGKLPEDIQNILTEICCSGFLHKLTGILPAEEPEIDGIKYKTAFLNFYDDLSFFIYLEKELRKYITPIEVLTFRKATEAEKQAWTKQQIELRKANPHIQKLYEYLTQK